MYGQGRKVWRTGILWGPPPAIVLIVCEWADADKSNRAVRIGRERLIVIQG